MAAERSGRLGNWRIIRNYLDIATIVVAVVRAVNVPNRRAEGQSKWGALDRTRAVGNKKSCDYYSKDLQVILSTV